MPGSVLFACHKTINCVQIPLHSQCEAVACRINLSDGQTLIILGHPTKTYNIRMENICKVTEYLCIKYENAVLWVTGDFNLPNIDWSLNATTGSTYPVELCNMLIESFNTFGLTQMVDSLTRESNILDLFATNRPSLIHKVEVILG